MTKSKKKEETPEPDFNWKTVLSEMEISDMLKRGLEFYVESRDLTVKNEKDLEKVLKDFKELNVGA